MRQVSRKFSSEELKQYIAEHPEKSLMEISFAFGCSITTIRQRIQRYDIPRKLLSKRNINIAKETLEQYMTEHPEDTLKEIAVAFDCSVPAIRKRIEKYAIQKEIPRKYKSKKNISYEALKLYLQTHPQQTLGEIGKVFDCSSTTIRNRIREYGIQYPKPLNISKESLQQYIAEHPEKSLMEISFAFDCSITTIQNRLREYHIERTPLPKGKKIRKSSVELLER